MILVENRNYLRLHHRALLENLKKIEERPDDRVKVEDSRSGKLTLKIDDGNGFRYVHSKYNPEKEAFQLISHIEGLSECDHLIFIGSGLGYAMSALHEIYPGMKLSVFEPDRWVLLQLLSYQRLDKLSSSLEFITDQEQELEEYIFEQAQKKQERFRFHVLPFYEQAYSKRIKEIVDSLSKGIRLKNNNVQTNIAFQQRWMINVLKNIPSILTTPNILLDVEQETFRDKPVILVSAGPSLNFEWDNLRQIKEEGLAYIFAVGSAINALIEHDLYPDAFCTYDPQEKNAQVVQKIIEQKISDIPMIFGSSVGYETLLNYPGQMLHMIISEDTISPQILRTTSGDPIRVLADQPSIAVITLELLAQLKVGTIILVGQNLAYLNNQFYASGIAYKDRPTELKESEHKNSLTIKDVSGKEIQTNDTFLSMLRQIENTIVAPSFPKVFNTTQGGAQINGAEYASLTEIIDKKLEQHTVGNHWAGAKNHYDLEKVKKNINNMRIYKDEFQTLVNEWAKSIKNLNNTIKKEQEEQIKTAIKKADRAFLAVQKNPFFKWLIAQMIKVQMTHIQHVFQEIRFEQDSRRKAGVLLKEMDHLYIDVIVNMKVITETFEAMIENVRSIDNSFQE
ncbi:MAG: 6-hydroxymethylpterin diphosphokinase MptE-like protein [Sporolactobacillus sp.]